MLENSASNAVLCNLALFARGTDSPGKENRNSGNGGDSSPLSPTDTGPVFCNAFEMQLASTFVHNAFNGSKVDEQYTNPSLLLFCSTALPSNANGDNINVYD